jgi:predicted anti-sigma-YlaC factor YlaD
MHLLTDFLNGRLEVETAQQVRWHIADCSDCRMIVHSARETFERYFSPPPFDEPRSKRHAA